MENTHLTMLEDDLVDLKRMLEDAVSDQERAHFRRLIGNTEAEIRSIRKRSRTGLDPRKVSTYALAF